MTTVAASRTRVLERALDIDQQRSSSILSGMLNGRGYIG